MADSPSGERRRPGWHPFPSPVLDPLRRIAAAATDVVQPYLDRKGEARQTILIPRTTPKAYISRMWALNLHPWWLTTEGGGDWHGACWRTADSDKRKAHGPELYRGRTIPILGTWGLYDARLELLRIGHPDWLRPERIWAAHYARACTDLLADAIKRVASTWNDDEDWYYVTPTFQDVHSWLCLTTSWIEMQRMVEVMAVKDIPYRELWSGWLEWTIERLRGPQPYWMHG